MPDSIGIPALSMTAQQTTVAEAAGTRERILRAALRVIGEQGIGAVSNRLLAAKAGVSLGSLTYHFSSQTELLREALLLYVSEEVTRLNEIAATIRAANPTEEQVAAQIEVVVNETILGPEQIAEFELHLHAARYPELSDASRRCFEAYDEVATAALQALNVPDAARHARAMVAYVSGLSVRRLGTGEHDASGTAEALLIYTRGVRAGESAPARGS